ncbi:protein of unknown function [Actinokineospora alba]|uniref:DUF4180 domain-containing protein n=1 Tax=Actinokineospora alba TaxID=504798 RepID=A0A1H0WDK9_9PSEU|nr:DUF4180 domain-containing protein [Actinokineospora alba]TDP68864.1 uncharacterized protein DUF4180 [Actinokineospora alba]SDI73826.1 protein of unknown function [Actinokineospora alba]SDP88688.1 protein of unknown function [Actinokineospora alba]
MMTVNDVSLAVCASDGPALARDSDATDLLGELWGQDVDMIVIPTTRLADDFFVLSTRVAGEIIQKFVNYRMRVTVLGDMAEHLARSEAMASFVRESNRGTHLWFVPTLDELTERLNRP